MQINHRFIGISLIIAISLYWLITDDSLQNQEQKLKEDTTSIEPSQAKVSENPGNNNITTKARYLQSVNALNLTDTELKKCIIEEFKSSSKKPSHISELKKLSCHADDIRNLKGIEALSNLTSVLIIGSDIQDVGPLASISSLESIYLKGGNANIQNISALTQLPHLKKITFPHMLDTYCYEAEAVLKSMKDNIDGPTSSNLNLVHCKGKKTAKVISALTKVKQERPLSVEEEWALSDYEHNLEWSRP